MANRGASLILVVMTALLVSKSAAGGPKPARNDTEQEKAIKEFVARVIKAVGQKDVPALLDMSEVPFNRQRGATEVDKKGLSRVFHAGLEEKPKFDGRHEVKSIETFKKAQSRFDELELSGAKQVLGDDDFVVHVEVQYPDRRLQVRLLIKMKDDKPRLVGWGAERKD